MSNASKILMGAMFAMLMSLVGYIVTSKDVKSGNLEASVADLATEVASLAESTTRLNILMSEIVVPVQKAQDKAIGQINTKLDKRTETILQAKANDERLTALEDRVSNGKGWSRADHEAYSKAISDRFSAGLARFQTQDTQIQILNDRIAELEGRYTGN